MTIREAVTNLKTTSIDLSNRRDVIEAMKYGKSVGAAAFSALRLDREDERIHALPGWPKCWGCESEPATRNDQGGVPVCADCAKSDLASE